MDDSPELRRSFDRGAPEDSRLLHKRVSLDWHRRGQWSGLWKHRGLAGLPLRTPEERRRAVNRGSTQSVGPTTGLFQLAGQKALLSLKAIRPPILVNRSLAHRLRGGKQPN